MTCGRLMFRTSSAAARPPIRSGGRIGACVRSRHVAERPGEREIVVPSHREDEPDRPGVDGQGADEHGEDDVGQEQAAEAGAQHILDEEREAAGDPAQLGAGRVAHGEDAEEDQEPAGQRGRTDGLEDRPGARRRGWSVSSARVPAVSNP